MKKSGLLLILTGRERARSGLELRNWPAALISYNSIPLFPQNPSAGRCFFSLLPAVHGNAGWFPDR